MAYNYKIPALQAKLKSMHAKMLDKEDYNELLMSETLIDAINILKQRFPMLVNLNESMHRKEIEIELANIFLYDINKIYTYLSMDEKEYCDLFLSKFSFMPDEKVDIHIWEKIYNHSVTSGSLKELVGTEIDMLNLLWIYRSKRFFGYPKEEVEGILIPINYKLSKKVLDTLVNLNYNELISEIDNTEYRGIIKSEENIYYDFDEYLYKKCIKTFRYNSFDISIVIAYLYLLQYEIKNIINIIESIRYKSDKDELRKRIII